MHVLNHCVSGEPVVEERKDEANGRCNLGHDAVEVIDERILLNLECTEIVPKKCCPNNVQCVALKEVLGRDTNMLDGYKANLNEFTEPVHSAFADPLE